MRLTCQQCADILLVSRTTLWRQEIDQHTRNFFMITDDELDAVMHILVSTPPEVDQ